MKTFFVINRKRMHITVKITATQDEHPHETREMEYDLTSDLTLATAISTMIEAAVQSGVCVVNSITTVPPISPDDESDDELDGEPDSESNGEPDSEPDAEPVQPVAEPPNQGVSGVDYIMIGNSRLHMFPNNNDIQHPTREQSRVAHDEFKRVLVQLYKQFCLYNDTDSYEDVTRLQKMLIAVGLFSHGYVVILHVGINGATKMSVMMKNIMDSSKWDIQTSKANNVEKVDVNYLLKEIFKLLMGADQYKELRYRKSAKGIDTIVQKLDAINKKLKIIKNMGEFNPDAPKVADIQRDWMCKYAN